MNTFKCIAFTIFCTAILIAATAAEVEGEAVDKTASRTWTSVKGETIEATFEKSQFGLVYLKKEDGSIIKIKKTVLTAEDQQIADSFTESAIDKALNAKKGDTLKKAPPELIDLFGDKLRTAKNKSVETDTLTDKVLGVYFSAHWCPPCRAFTPQLVKFYDALKKEGKPFEIVFVSSDRSQDAMYEYMKEMGMNWVALPYGDKHKETLAAKFNVSGIPKLVILNSKGELITEKGRNYVTGENTAIFEKWAAGKER